MEMSEARPTTCGTGPGVVMEKSEDRGSWTWRSAAGAEAETETEAGVGHLVSEMETTDDDPTVAVVQPVTEKKSASERTVVSSIKDS